MTQDEWRAIVRAWAAWVNGEGPPVQGRYTGTDWLDWEQSASIRSDQFAEWRVKPTPPLVRMLRGISGKIVVVSKSETAPEPKLCDGEQWIGGWQEIPEC